MTDFMEDKTKKEVKNRLESEISKIKERELQQQKRREEIAERRERLANFISEKYRDPLIQKYIMLYGRMELFKFKSLGCLHGRRPKLIFEKEGIFLEYRPLVGDPLRNKKNFSSGRATIIKYGGYGSFRRFSYDLGEIVKDEEDFKRYLCKKLTIKLK